MTKPEHILLQAIFTGTLYLTTACTAHACTNQALLLSSKAVLVYLDENCSVRGMAVLATSTLPWLMFKYRLSWHSVMIEWRQSPLCLQCYCHYSGQVRCCKVQTTIYNHSKSPFLIFSTGSNTACPWHLLVGGIAAPDSESTLHKTHQALILEEREMYRNGTRISATNLEECEEG